MFPASMCGSAPVKVLAPAALTKVECIFPEKTCTIDSASATTIRSRSLAACTRDSPSVASIRTMIPEKHPGMATTLEHFKSDKMPTSSNIPSGHSTTPTVQTVVVNGVAIVNPQLAPIIGDDLEVVAACLEDSHATCPAYSEVIAPSEAGPPASCVTIVHVLDWPLNRQYIYLYYKNTIPWQAFQHIQYCCGCNLK